MNLKQEEKFYQNLFLFILIAVFVIGAIIGLARNSTTSVDEDSPYQWGVYH